MYVIHQLKVVHQLFKTCQHHETPILHKMLQNRLLSLQSGVLLRLGGQMQPLHPILKVLDSRQHAIHHLEEVQKEIDPCQHQKATFITQKWHNMCFFSLLRCF